MGAKVNILFIDDLTQWKIVIFYIKYFQKMGTI
jgi:hypothetical protein